MNNAANPVGKPFEVIATVNTHLLEPSTLAEFAANGATFLRVNGSHVQPAEIARYAGAIRRALGSGIKILVDLPGNKVRTSLLQPIQLKVGQDFELRADQVNYAKFISALAPGDTLLANDSLFKFTVVSGSGDRAVLRSHSEGSLLTNKGVHLVGKHVDLPLLFERDHALIRHSAESGVDYLGLSFVRTAADVEEAKAAIRGTSLKLLVKVETAPAVANLDAILGTADEFLVDRGDLSCDVGIENVDYFQKLILRKGKARGKRVYFATQFLHSMLQNNVPLIAEACGLSDAIRCGVDGVQLSEETAIGKHPLEVLKTVQRMHAAAAPGTAARAAGGAVPVLWLTGQSGAGKTTIAREAMARLEARGLRGGLVDGDDYRAFWGNDLGYTREDRVRNLRTIIFTAHQASRSFDFVIVSSLSPYREIRDLAREKLPGFREVHVHCAPETCRRRDPKGHYKKADAGEHRNFVGVSEEYESPLRPDLVIDTDRLDLDASVRTLLSSFDAT